MIIKDDKWVQKIINLTYDFHPTPNLAILGYDVIKRYHGSSTPAYSTNADSLATGWKTSLDYK
jgi:hypothetical protein